LGQIYRQDRTRASLLKIYSTNKFTDTGSGYVAAFRDFLGTGDTGWQMFRHPVEVPENTILYYNEVMSGFEYAAAATMLQYGMVNEGINMVNSIANRYDGRLRAAGEVHMASNSTVFGCGSPFGEDECGDFYGRALSSWSVLLAMQGFIYDGPKQTIGFKPVWQPENHKSFFSASSGWGLFTQTQNRNAQTSQIAVKYGSVDVKNIVLSIPADKEVIDIAVQINGKKLPVSSFKHSENIITVTLKETCNINNGSDFIVSFQLFQNSKL
jgi:hypothetical protein